MKLELILVVAVVGGRGMSLTPLRHTPHVNRPYNLSPKSEHWGANMTTPELIEAFGYPAEIHQVKTADGYLLELHRIPHGASGPSTDPRPPVFLQHGILQSSADWVMNTADEALAYILADLGYDVWLGNFRGNTYSHSHEELSSDDIEYWNFNWDEMAYYDLPACIDYVLQATGVSALHYVGYSMGTTTFFALMSERPEYNNKVKVMVAMAPVAFVEHIKGPLSLLAPYSDNFDTILTLLGKGEFLPSSEVMDYLAENYCDVEADKAEVCYNILFLIAGPDPSELNKDFLPAILAHTPAGTSVHTVNHYGQLVMSANFAKYNFGPIGNMNHYGQNEPPLYNFANVTVPVGLYWSNGDWLADPTDVARLRAGLPNVVVDHKVSLDIFNHLDFTWAMHADEYVYTYVIELLSQY